MKNSKVKFPKFTKEQKEAFKNRRLKERSSLSLAYQLGIYVGEQIVYKYLPTISVDLAQTKTNISVTCAEGDKYRNLNDAWFNFSMKNRTDENDRNGEAWINMQDYYETLLDKYLPDTVECLFHLLNITEEHMLDFKKGIGHCLWDSDCSHYSTNLENIDVKADTDGFFTVITLTRHKIKESSIRKRS